MVGCEVFRRIVRHAECLLFDVPDDSAHAPAFGNALLVQHAAQLLRELYARSQALIVPGEEDFGINMVEALASGKPIVALGWGGVQEILPEGDLYTGLLYKDATEEDLDNALARFDACRDDFVPERLQSRAEQFSDARFQENMQRILAARVPGSVSSPTWPLASSRSNVHSDANHLAD